MILLSHIFYGFIMAFVGLMPPGMLNMTAVRTAIEKGRDSALRFAAGAASIVTVHSFIAFTFAKYLIEHPEIIARLKMAGIGVFFALAVFFFIQARKKFKGAGKEGEGNFFMKGLFMSLINMLGIPFYLGASAVMESKGMIELGEPNNYYLVMGAVIGAFALFATYVMFAKLISEKASFIAKNINYVLSGLFVVLGVVLLYKMMVG